MDFSTCRLREEMGGRDVGLLRKLWLLESGRCGNDARNLELVESGEPNKLDRLRRRVRRLGAGWRVSQKTTRFR